jgi:hypothetical protein
MSRTRLTNKIHITPQHALVPVLAAAAIGGTLALSQPAGAATANWDAIAQKESGGNWSINTGNGYGGGLQISPTTSAALGGPSTAAGIAALPKAQQIALAEKILAAQGPGAWPNTYASGSSATGSSATGSSATGSSATGSSATGSSATGSGSSGSAAATQPSTSGSAGHQTGGYFSTPSSHASTATTLPRGTSTQTRTVTPASTAAPYFTTAQAGVFQTQVAVWQARMDALGYHVQVDGHYGPASAAAAHRLQTVRGIQVDGIVGPQTWGATFG